MARQMIREQKRTVSKGARPGASAFERQLAKESALALLDRSIDFGHARLAVIRLSMAVSAGADVPAAHWVYCQDAAMRCKDTSLLTILRGAIAAATRPPTTSTPQ